jgi:hypothetical protein
MTTALVPSLSELTGQYALDPAHSRIGFVARHAMVTKVRGAFNDFVGTGFLDGDNPGNSKISVTIQAASIDTRNEQRDGHLRNNSRSSSTRRSPLSPPRPASSTTRPSKLPATSRSAGSPSP